MSFAAAFQTHCGLPPEACNTPQTRRMLEVAQHFWNAGLATSETPCDSIPVLWSAATALHNFQLFAQAEFLYRRILELDPQHVGSLNYLGVLSCQCGAVAPGIEYFQQAIALQPQDANLYNNLGNAFQTQKRYEAALKQYELAMELSPDNLTSLINIANLYKTIKRNTDSEAAYRRALELKPDAEEVHFQLGNLYYDQEQLTDAVTSYQAAVRINPQFTEAYTNLANAYRDLDQLAEAAFSYRRTLELAPEVFQLHAMLANVLVQQRQYEEGLKHYREVLRLCPDHKPAQYMVAMLIGSEYQGALQEYTQQLFDEYADRFDLHLVGALNYRVPELLHETYLRLIGTPSPGGLCVDLGCGTGLCGPLFRPLVDRLIGCDISSKMVAKARAEQVYDELHVQDLCQTLQQLETPARLILAADVFVYVGALEEVLQHSASALEPGGRLLFTVEQFAGSGFHVGNHGRFAHSISYIKNLAAKHHLQVESLEEAMLRSENKQPVMGLVWCLRKEV